jgi:hypothetical protein
VLTPVKNFCGASNQMVTVSFRESLQAMMKLGVHYHQTETKKISKEWHHFSSPKPKKFQMQPPAGKIMLTLLA